MCIYTSFIFIFVTYVLSILLTLTTICHNDVTERQKCDKWPFHPEVTETSLESCSPHRFSRHELPCLLIADKQADVSFSVLQDFFFSF